MTKQRTGHTDEHAGAAGQYWERLSIFNSPAFFGTIGQTDVFAGSVYGFDAADAPWVDAHIFLLEGFPAPLRPETNQTGKAAFAGLTDDMAKPRLNVPWRDGGAPMLHRDWWVSLHRLLGEGIFQAVAIGCDGGRGRTGTALAILSGLERPDRDPIAHVRQRRPGSIETLTQVAYLELILQRPMDLTHKVDTLRPGFARLSPLGTTKPPQGLQGQQQEADEQRVGIQKTGSSGKIARKENK